MTSSRITTNLDYITQSAINKAVDANNIFDQKYSINEIHDMIERGKWAYIYLLIGEDANLDNIGTLKILDVDVMDDVVLNNFVNNILFMSDDLDDMVFVYNSRGEDYEENVGLFIDNIVKYMINLNYDLSEKKDGRDLIDRLGWVLEEYSYVYIKLRNDIGARDALYHTYYMFKRVFTDVLNKYTKDDYTSTISNLSAIVSELPDFNNEYKIDELYALLEKYKPVDIEANSYSSTKLLLIVTIIIIFIIIIIIIIYATKNDNFCTK